MQPNGADPIVFDSITTIWPTVFVSVFFGCAIPLVAIVVEHQRKSRRAELDYELKRDMLAQGRTPEEIQAVLDMTSVRKA